MAKITVVINTLNEEKNISRAISSVSDFADEIIVCDMFSDDKTVDIAKKLGAKVFTHKKTNYVEPARNFALSKATGDWIFILDADEEITEDLKKKLIEVSKDNEADYVLIPRKNILFGKWMKHSRWWPDYLVRFFKNGFVIWNNQIHSEPSKKGKELKLEEEERYTIVHHNYQTITQYLERLIRYTEIQAENLKETGYHFVWTDLIKKPLNEFLSRYFAGEGYKDGVHGLALSLMQSFSELIVYARIWENKGFKDEDTPLAIAEIKKATQEINWWIEKDRRNLLQKMLQKIKRS
jgi:(heptosyl)LPS beta-1,4-glucosyltransferase